MVGKSKLLSFIVFLIHFFSVVYILDFIIDCEQYDQPKGTKQFECKFQIPLKDIRREDVTLVDEWVTVRCDEAFSLKPQELEDLGSWLKAFVNLSKKS